MRFHTVVDQDEKVRRQFFFDTLAPNEVIQEAPRPIIQRENINHTLTGMQWIKKLKENDLNAQEQQYVDQMRAIVKNHDALAIPSGGWNRLSSQNYSDHRNRKLGSDFFLYIAKPETLTAQEMADLTAIHCHSELDHPIIGECHALQIYHLYHGGKLGVFESGIILECNEDPTLRLVDGKFQHKPNQCPDGVSNPNSSWHQDWNHNTFALSTDGVTYHKEVTAHPLQSKELSWTAKPSNIENAGIHVIYGLNHWLASYDLEDDLKVTLKEQAIGLSGCYLAAVEDDDYKSDGERGEEQYISRSEKIYYAVSWAKMHSDPKAMSQAYGSIIKTVSMIKGIAFKEVGKNFENTIFKHIADAYIERIPGKIITHISHGKDYLVQHHPSKSLMIESAQQELALTRKVVHSSSPFYTYSNNQQGLDNNLVN
ncbi:hypothetical protein L3V83_12725 [Thiotrichales bacterium 19X7-9]|nr:hypothetical protein [Thiotrichales bacterium 19X7-9]